MTIKQPVFRMDSSGYFWKAKTPLLIDYILLDTGASKMTLKFGQTDIAHCANVADAQGFITEHFSEMVMKCFTKPKPTAKVVHAAINKSLGL